MSNNIIETKIKSMMLLTVLFSMMAGVSAKAALTATPSSSRVFVNGRQTAFIAYQINGSNYFKLRDLAFSLNHTEKNFNVTWDATKNAILLESEKVYEPTGGELAGATDRKEKKAKATGTVVYVDGVQKDFQTYNIDGSSYFKLRDIMKTFHIGVTWKEKENAIGLDTSFEYDTSEETGLSGKVLSAKEVYERCSSSVFYLETFDMDGNALAGGSGFFIDKERAVTNFHVLEDAFSAKITLADNRIFNVKGVTGYDAQMDLAVIKIDGKGLNSLTFGNSEVMKGGEKIYAIGSPMGLYNTISEGIVSNQIGRASCRERV